MRGAFWGLPTTLGSFCRLSGIRGSLVLILLNRPHKIRLAFLLLVELSWFALKRDDGMEIHNESFETWPSASFLSPQKWAHILLQSQPHSDGSVQNKC